MAEKQKKKGREEIGNAEERGQEQRFFAKEWSGDAERSVWPINDELLLWTPMWLVTPPRGITHNTAGTIGVSF